VVDDTLHSLGHFRRLAPKLGPAEAAVATLERTAPAHALTSAVLIAGFGVCGLSELVPIARFGSLAAAALGMALAADLLLVPALLAGPGSATGGKPGPRVSAPGVGLVGIVVLSNHLHLLLSVESQEHMSQFMEHFGGNTAREVNRFQDWSGSLVRAT